MLGGAVTFVQPTPVLIAPVALLLGVPCANAELQASGVLVKATDAGKGPREQNRILIWQHPSGNHCLSQSCANRVTAINDGRGEITEYQ